MNIIVTSESQLFEFITTVVRNELKRFAETCRFSQVAESHFPEILNVEQAAQVLDLAVSTVYGKVNRLELPFSKKHGKLRFKRSQLLEWIDSGDKKTKEQIQQEVKISIRKPSTH